MKTAAAYLRISRDDAADLAGVERQERLCRLTAEQRGLDLVEVLTDNDLSAYRRMRRPGFERLVELLKSGTVQAVVAYHVDRLYRRLEDLARLVDVVEQTGAEIHTVAAGDVDLSTASGRMIARILGSVAQHESEHMAERVKAKKDELALQGRPAGGHAPFGYRWQNGTYVIEETEAAIVRSVAAQILAGATLADMVTRLEGTPTRQGGKWYESTVRQMVLRPALTGVRVHRGQNVGAAGWPPILDVATSQALRDVFHERRHHRQGHGYLLSGLVVTPTGERMHGSPDHGVWCYRPVSGLIQVDAHRLEAFVTEAVLIVLDASALPAPAQAQTADVLAIEARLDELAREWAEGAIGTSQWRQARAVLQERLQAAQAQQARQPRSTTVVNLLRRPGAVRQRWATLDFRTRKAVIGAVVEQVVVSRATRGRWTRLEDRVELRWRV